MSTAKVLFPNDEEIYKIITGLPNQDKLQDKIWKSFCLENEALRIKNVASKPHRFKKHPHNFSKEENNDEENNDVDTRSKDDDCSSMDSDDMAEALFGKQKNKNYTKCQSAKCQRTTVDFINEDEYDSLDEFCDVTFRNMGSVLHKPKKQFVPVEEASSKSPNKKIVPSSVISSPNKSSAKMMTKIKPLKRPLALKEVEASENSIVPEQIREIEIETVPIEYDMNKDKRLKTVLQKCNNAMDDIRLLVDIGIPLPDGEEDYIRRKKRAVEFSNRFSRIYLYELNRLINDIRKLLRPHTTHKALSLTTSVRMNLSSRTNITQKFIQALQLVQQSLQAYYNHLPTSIIVGAPEKLKDLLNLCITICQLQNVVMTTPDGAGDKEAEMTENIFRPFNTRCKSLLERINECCEIESTTSLMKSDRSKLTLLGYNLTNGKRTSEANSNMQLSVNSSRFSMYGGGGVGGGHGGRNNRGVRKDAYWRNAIAALGKKHFNVTSRYKTAKYKHRPDIDRAQLNPNQPHSPSFQAFPINARPAGLNNKLVDGNVNDHRWGEHPVPSSNVSNANSKMMMAVGQNESEMSVQREKGDGIRKGRGRPRYSLNDDDINTIVQNVIEDNGGEQRRHGHVHGKDETAGHVPKEILHEEAGEDSGQSSCCGAVEVRRSKTINVAGLNKKQQEKYHAHAGHNSKVKQPPPHGPQPAPYFHLNHLELIGESSQCDLAPPGTSPAPAPPVASASSTTAANSAVNLTVNTPRGSVCGDTNKCQSCQQLDEEVTRCRAAQTATAVDNQLGGLRPFGPCPECQRHQQMPGGDQKQVPLLKGSSNDENWNRLNTDCDRTLKMLDARTIRRMSKVLAEGRNAIPEGGADGGLELMGEERLMVENSLSKKHVAKKLADLVKKSCLKKGGGRKEEAGAGRKSANGGGDKRRDKVTVTSVTGVKNAKLICIRDDNSLHLDTTTSDIEDVQDNPKTVQADINNIKSNKRRVKTNETSTINKLHYVHSQTQTDVGQQQKQSMDSDAQKVADVQLSNGQKRKNVKISKLPKAKMRRPLQMLDKEMSLNVIKYKLEYHKATKENPMYKKAANGVEPWTLMEKVSDGILDHLLLSIAREIEVVDVLVKLIESEFYAA